jgi:hypothetical protein
MAVLALGVRMGKHEQSTAVVCWGLLWRFGCVFVFVQHWDVCFDCFGCGSDLTCSGHILMTPQAAGACMHAQLLEAVGKFLGAVLACSTSCSSGCSCGTAAVTTTTLTCLACHRLRAVWRPGGMAVLCVFVYT